MRPDRLKRTLYVYWGVTLVRMEQILPRGDYRPTLYVFFHHLKFKRIGTHFGRAWVTRVALLHGVTFTPERAEGSLHGEGCLQRRARIPLHGEDYLPDVQTALCTSAIRSGANLYTYIGPMVPRCSTWQVLVPF